MTVGELKQAMDGVPEGAEVLLYADLEAEAARPFASLAEKAYVCGYFALDRAEYTGDEVVLTVGVNKNF